MSTYTIPSHTDATREIVKAAEDALANGVALAEALPLDTLPSEADTAATVKAAEDTLASAREVANVAARIRHDAVRLAYAHKLVGKGKEFANQRDLARALKCSQPRVSQIKASVDAHNVVTTRKTALRAAAAAGGLDRKTEGLASTIHALAVDGTPDEIKATVVALEAGRIPTGPARTLDAEALIKACERVLVMSGECIDVTADRDAVERAVKMLTTARHNLTMAIRTASDNVSKGADMIG